VSRKSEQDHATDKPSKNNPPQLSLTNLTAGLFVVLLVGYLVTFAAFISEHLFWHANCSSRQLNLICQSHKILLVQLFLMLRAFVAQAEHRAAAARSIN
jgi:hypothetical protein